jgi:hypothetical protein
LSLLDELHSKIRKITLENEAHDAELHAKLAARDTEWSAKLVAKDEELSKIFQSRSWKVALFLQSLLRIFRRLQSFFSVRTLL